MTRIVNVTAVVTAPVSEICTQYVPGLPITLIWAVPLGVAVGVELVSVHVAVAPPVLAVPTPSPTADIEEGARLDNDRLIVPLRAAVNVKVFVDFGSNVPENVSVGFSVFVGSVEFRNSPHPTTQKSDIPVRKLKTRWRATMRCSSLIISEHSRSLTTDRVPRGRAFGLEVRHRIVARRPIRRISSSNVETIGGSFALVGSSAGVDGSA